MAAARTRPTVPVGSKQWVLNERDQISQFEDQENEDFAFSARNEFDWLNEHMSDIFNNSQLNITEIFKTPGKLRGKTPRTGRKRNALETRAPLTDVFASNVRYNGTPNYLSEKEGKKIRIQSPAPAHASRTYHTDSGYHGSTGDEMEVDSAQRQLQGEAASRMELENGEKPERTRDRTTEDSFHSARENLASKEAPLLPAPIPGAFPRDTPMPADEPVAAAEADDAMQVDDANENLDEDRQGSPPLSVAPIPAKPVVRKSSLNFATLPAREPLAKKSIGKRDSKVNNADKRTGPLGSSYFGRFTGGKSLGYALQQDAEDMEVEAPVKPQAEREAVGGNAKSHSKSSTQRLHERINMLAKAPAPRPAKSVASSAAGASSEQPGYPDLSKSVAYAGAADAQPLESAKSTIRLASNDDEDDWILPPANNSHSSRPQLAKSRSVDVMEKINGKESIGGEYLGFHPIDKEMAKQMSPARMDPIRESGQPIYGHQKSVSTTVLPSPSHLQQYEITHSKAISVSNPAFSTAESTTPAGSPSRLHLEGHLSASKSKLQSIMKSARGLFTSSAGISAQAKLEALSPPSRSQFGAIDEIMGDEMPQQTELYPKLRNETQSSLADSSIKGWKMRNSMDKEEKRKEKEARDHERAEAELAKARERERQKAREFKEKEDALAAAKPTAGSRTLENTSKPIRQSPRRAAKEVETDTADETITAQEMAPPAKPQPQASTGQKKDTRRVAKPAAKPIAKPPQVAIRVGTMSQRIPLTNNALSSTLQDTLSASASKTPGLNKKPSNSSIHTTASSASLKSSTSSKPKSLVVAAQKREQAEKEAQRREDEKRERERKRAAAHDEALRKEKELRQREEAERQKERERVAAEEAKRKAQKEAADKKRLEMSKKAQAELAKKVQEQKRAAHELAQSQQNARAEAANNRPPSRMEKFEDFPKPPNRPINPAKAAIKRVFDPENEDELSRGSRPTNGQNYQSNQDKRRRTEDEEEIRPAASRPTLQPPIRQSNVIKVKSGINPDQNQAFGHSTHGGPKSSMYQTNYSGAPLPATSHHKQGGLNASYQQQQPQPPLPHHHHHQQQQQGYGAQPSRPANPMDMAKYQSGKIPFADAAAQFKTPTAGQKTVVASASKTNRSSPGHGTNGDHIQLDDILTDSEDEDSEYEREKKDNLPDWVRTPALFEQLGAQERLNPDAVFGPIAPLNMEEMFRDKSRHAKFRARTSSANWGGSDRLTEDDIRNDLAARDKLRRDGAWSFRLGEM